MEGEPSKEGEVLPPEKAEKESEVGDGVNIYAQIIQSISHYTDRPDLLLDVVEKYDPGFIKRMNTSAQEYSEKLRDGRFYFGKRQAYTHGKFVLIFVDGSRHTIKGHRLS